MCLNPGIKEDSMSKVVDVGAVNDFNEGTMKSVTVEGEDILLARVEDRYYAVGNICPHLQARLSEGTLEGYIVTCPRHGSQFDVRTGENIRWLKGSGLASSLAKVVKPPRPLKSYTTEIRDGRITIID